MGSSIFGLFKKNCLLILLLHFNLCQADIYADVEVLINLLTRQGCRILDLALLPPSVSSDLPQLNSNEVVLDFRKAFEDFARLSFNRALFYSYVLQRIEYSGEPRLRYYLYSLFTDLAAYNQVDFSSIIYDKNKVKLRNNLGNLLQNRFAPCADRSFNVTSRLITVTDCQSEPGSFHLSQSLDMALSLWRYSWKGTTNTELYEIKRFVDDEEDGAISFYGPSKNISVKWTAPYLVCSKFPKWYLTVTSPIVRYDPPLEPTFVAASMISIKLDYLSINQCSGSRSLNVFAKTDKCKDETTYCEPSSGNGFQRGSYICKCKPGFVLPKDYVDGFTGREIEMAKEHEYRDPSKFNCILENTDELFVTTPMDSIKKENISQVFDILKSVYNSDCSSVTSKFIIKKGLKDQIQQAFNLHFHSEIHSTWRLALFLGNYVQNNEAYLSKSKVKERLVFGEELIGELLAVYLSHEQIVRIALTFDDFIFPKQVLKYLYVGKTNEEIHVNVSTASNSSDNLEYKKMIGLIGGETRPMASYMAELRSREDPRVLTMRSLGQKTFHGPTLADSFRISDPYFYCYSNRSLIWSNIPFYKKRGLGGLLSVALPLDVIDVDQCDSSPHEYFRSTHHCDKRTTVCVPVKGKGFQPGGYKCVCRPQFNNVTIGNKTVKEFDGFEVEAEYEKMIKGLDNNYSKLKCVNDANELSSGHKIVLEQQNKDDTEAFDENSKDDLGLDDVAVFISGDKMPEGIKDLAENDTTIQTQGNSAWKDIIGQYSPSNIVENKVESHNEPQDISENDYYDEEDDDNDKNKNNDADVIDSAQGYWVKFIGSSKNKNGKVKKTSDPEIVNKHTVNKGSLEEGYDRKTVRMNKETTLRAKLSVNYSPNFIDPDEEHLPEYMTETKSAVLQIQGFPTESKVSRSSTEQTTLDSYTVKILPTLPTMQSTPVTEETTEEKIDTIKEEITSTVLTTAVIKAETSSQTLTTESAEIILDKSPKTTKLSNILTTPDYNTDEKTTSTSSTEDKNNLSDDLNPSRDQYLSEQYNISPKPQAEYLNESDNLPNSNTGSEKHEENGNNNDPNFELGKRKGDLGVLIKSWLDKYKAKDGVGILRDADFIQVENNNNGDFQNKKNRNRPKVDKTLSEYVTNNRSGTALDDYDLPAENKNKQTIVEIDEEEETNNKNSIKKNEELETTTQEEFNQNVTNTEENKSNVARFARIFLTVH